MHLWHAMSAQKTAVGNLKLPPLRSSLFPKRDNCSACPHMRGKDCPSFDKEGRATQLRREFENEGQTHRSAPTITRDNNTQP